MGMWGFGGFDDDGNFTDGTNTWDLKETFPSIEDYYNATFAEYEGDADAFYGTEKTGNEEGPIIDVTKAHFTTFWG